VIFFVSADEARHAHRSAAGHGVTIAVAAQESKPKPPAAADWTALAKLPDLTGVWEAPTVGRGGQGRAGGPPPVPELTPGYAAKKRELDARNFDDTDAANCLPTGMPAIMGHPFPYEFLLTPGKVSTTRPVASSRSKTPSVRKRYPCNPNGPPSEVARRTGRFPQLVDPRSSVMAAFPRYFALC
jgi:hypothetical protein